MTIYRFIHVLYGGEIVHQNSTSLVRWDGLFDLACRTVRSFQEELPSLFSGIEKGGYQLHEQNHKEHCGLHLTGMPTIKISVQILLG